LPKGAMLTHGNLVADMSGIHAMGYKVRTTPIC